MLLFRCYFFSYLLLIFFIFSSVGYSQVCDFSFKRLHYKTRNQFCKPGELVKDFYNLDTLIRCEDMEVDHFFAQRFLYDNGVCDIKKLKEMIKDRDNLVFTLKSTNRRKGIKSPYEFAKTFDDPKIQKRILDRAILIENKYNFYPSSTNTEKRALLRKVESFRKDNIKPRFILAGNNNGIIKKFSKEFGDSKKKKLGSKVLYVAKKGGTRLLLGKAGAVLFLVDGYQLGTSSFEYLTTSQDAKKRKLQFQKLLDIGDQ